MERNVGTGGTCSDLIDGGSLRSELSAAVISGSLSRANHTDGCYCNKAPSLLTRRAAKPVVSELSAVDELSVIYGPITVGLFSGLQLSKLFTFGAQEFFKKRLKTWFVMRSNRLLWFSSGQKWEFQTLMVSTEFWLECLEVAVMCEDTTKNVEEPNISVAVGMLSLQ